MKEKITKNKFFTIYVGTFFVLFMIIMGAIAKNNFNSKVGTITERDEKEAIEILNKGCTLFENNEYEDAIKLWEEIYYDYSGTTSWGKATYNIGLAYICLEEYNKAIPYFLEILDSDVDDLEEGQCVMEAYRNYRYKSCRQLSYCYEQLEDYNKALEYSYLAKDKYKYESWCGTCSASEYEYLEYDIRRLTVFKEWNKNKDLVHKFKLTYEIKAKSEVEYQLYLPFPLAKNDSVTFFNENIKVIRGNPIYNLVDTENGYALNLTCIGPCSVEIKYISTSKDNISDDKIFETFSLEDEEEDDYYSYWKSFCYWVYCYYMDKNVEDQITLTLNSCWIQYPPNWEYNTWIIHETSIESGWNSIYSDVSCIPKDFEEPSPRLLGGYCLEYDYERNNLVIGKMEGLGVFDIENNTYKIIENYCITAITIDYNNDIYYFGGLSTGVKKYYVNNDTYISYLPEYREYIDIKDLAYDHFNDRLLIGETHTSYEKFDPINDKGYNEINSVFYDMKNNISLTYSFHDYQLYINNYTNHSQLIIDMPKNNIFNEGDIFDLNIEYDHKFKLVFFGFSYDTYLYNTQNSSLVIYNIETGNLSYISFPYCFYGLFSEVRDVCLDSKSHILYIATEYGLYYYNITTEKIGLVKGFENKYIGSLTLDNNNRNLYVSQGDQLEYHSNHYLYKYIIENEKKERIT